MTLTRHAQPKPNDSSESSQKTKRILSADKLTESPTFPHTAPVDAKHRQTAKFWDIYPLTRRQHRQHDAGGFFSSVDYASGFMPGMRGLPEEAIPNKRVVFRVSDRCTRQFLPKSKTQQLGAVIMTAITMGNTARTLSAYLPHLPLAPIGRKRKESPLLVFKQSRTGVIAYRKDTPVAWIVLGYHQGQVSGKPKTTTFVDVAYHRQTLHGINLETFECANLQDAKTALFTLFSIPQEKQGSTATPFSALVESEASDNGGAKS